MVTDKFSMDIFLLKKRDLLSSALKRRTAQLSD
jgi:hypothetical protein